MEKLLSDCTESFTHIQCQQTFSAYENDLILGVVVLTSAAWIVLILAVCVGAVFFKK